MTVHWLVEGNVQEEFVYRIQKGRRVPQSAVDIEDSAKIGASLICWRTVRKGNQSKGMVWGRD